VLSPDEALHVDGNIKTNGSLILTGTTASSNFNNGTFRTAGGAAITKNLIIGDGLKVTGVSEFDNIQPSATDFYDSGTVLKRWKNVRTKNLIAETIEGVLTGNIVGNASTATNLKFTSTFKMEGDVTAPSFIFDGQVGGNTKTFTTTLTSALISSKDEPFPLVSTPLDFVLVFRPSIGLIKETRNTFVGDLAVPIGAILPYAGAEAHMDISYATAANLNRQNILIYMMLLAQPTMERQLLTALIHLRYQILEVDFPSAKTIWIMLLLCLIAQVALLMQVAEM
jgi:hypothetical protein